MPFLPSLLLPQVLLSFIRAFLLFIWLLSFHLFPTIFLAKYSHRAISEGLVLYLDYISHNYTRIFHAYFHSFQKPLKYTKAILGSREVSQRFTCRGSSRIISIHKHQPQATQHYSLQHRAASPHTRENVMIVCVPIPFPREKKGWRIEENQAECVRVLGEQNESIKHRRVKRRDHECNNQMLTAYWTKMINTGLVFSWR